MKNSFSDSELGSTPRHELKCEVSVLERLTRSEMNFEEAMIMTSIFSWKSSLRRSLGDIIDNFLF